jgi:hypothetical protein
MGVEDTQRCQGRWQQQGELEAPPRVQSSLLFTSIIDEDLHPFSNATLARTGMQLSTDLLPFGLGKWLNEMRAD